ncbi:MAG: DNA-binding protein [bacterium]
MGRVGVRCVALLGLLPALSGIDPQPLHARGPLSPEQALSFVGSFQTGCGTVVSAKYHSAGRRAPTFLNLDRPYPDHIFTALIWGEDRGKFPYPPEQALANKRICVSGVIENYKGRAEIIVREPSQISSR